MNIRKVRIFCGLRSISDTRKECLCGYAEEYRKENRNLQGRRQA